MYAEKAMTRFAHDPNMHQAMKLQIILDISPSMMYFVII